MTFWWFFIALLPPKRKTNKIWEKQFEVVRVFKTEVTNKMGEGQLVPMPIRGMLGKKFFSGLVCMCVRVPPPHTQIYIFWHTRNNPPVYIHLQKLAYTSTYCTYTCFHTRREMCTLTYTQNRHASIQIRTQTSLIHF